MSIMRQNRIMPGGAFTAAAAMGLSLAPAPAAAQDNPAVLGILVECAKIDEPSARLACYDNNIRAAGGMARNTVPGRVPGVSGGAAPIASGGNVGGFGGDDLRAAAPAQGFGREDIRTPQRFQPPAGAQSITATVARAQMREPGIYLMTMQDQTQWIFAQSVRNDFRDPRPGTKVEIERGSLGSYLAVVDGQEPIRVRRVR